LKMDGERCVERRQPPPRLGAGPGLYGLKGGMQAPRTLSILFTGGAWPPSPRPAHSVGTCEKRGGGISVGAQPPH